MKNEIKYSKIDYILVRTEVNSIWKEEFDTCLYSFDNLKIAKKYALKDIQETMRSMGIVYSKECDNAVSYEKYCGNDYWCYESDNICISWEIRKIHHRTTSEWDDPNEYVKWVKESV